MEGWEIIIVIAFLLACGMFDFAGHYAKQTQFQRREVYFKYFPYAWSEERDI